MNTFPALEMRAVMRRVLPEHDQYSDAPREPKFTYVPPSHAKALHPDATIVEGMRGAGKSHWWAALNSNAHREYLSVLPPLAEVHRYEVSQGFGIGLSPEKAPGKDTLSSLIARGVRPRHIWQAVVGVHTLKGLGFPAEGTWFDRTVWITEHAETFDQMLFTAGEVVRRQGKPRLILFDALDRLADDWRSLRPLASSLMQLALDLMGNPGIRLKLFMRPDMLEDTEILKFPDASKLLGRRAALSWQRTDLYGLLFQCMANDEESGALFRLHCERLTGQRWVQRDHGGEWTVPSDLRNDADTQKKVFHALAGPAMSTSLHGHKRGFPYTWLPNHLVDSRDQVSPRSFVAALRVALDVDPPSGWDYALHFRAIEAGVQEASRIRVKEVTEHDYPWVQPLMNPLRNQIIIPCRADEIIGIWRTAKTLHNLRTEGRMTGEVRLLPAHLDEGPAGVLRDLRDLGIIDYLRDGRVQMPDVYRIAFGFGRKGGVKPLR